MHVLFVHQNFPAQFRFLAPRLVAEHGWECSFCTARVQDQLPGVRKIIYKPVGGATLSNSYLTRNYENSVGHAHGIFNAMKEAKDVRPDLVVAHSGFGSSLFLPFLYDAPIINYFELFYRPIGQDLGYRPERPVGEMELLRSMTNNAMILLDAANCDAGWTPTRYQHEFFPQEFQSKLDVIYDGVDTSVYHRKPDAAARIRATLKIDPSHRIVTYVARGFEMLRGFDIFMKAAKLICDKRSDVTFIVVGTDKVHYGGDLQYIKEDTFRHHVLNGDKYDLSRFRFPGYVQQETLADILSCGDAHIYLTEPFVVSWSMVDAMACGAVLIASDQECVREFVQSEVNGMLVDFFDHEALAARTLAALGDPPAFRHLGEAAAKTVTDHYALESSLTRIKKLFERVIAKGPRRPSTALEKLVKQGTLPRVTTDPRELERKARVTDPPPPR